MSEDSDDWKALIPGKPVLARFAAVANLSLARAKSLYIDAVQRDGHAPFKEIEELFEEMSAAPLQGDGNGSGELGDSTTKDGTVAHATP